MKKRAKEYAEYYKKHLLEECLPFWDRCIDEECGGYFTCFDREGNLTDSNKYVWFQGRQCYTYSLLYNRIEKRQEWLDKAYHGYKFLVKYCYAGNGRWNLRLDRKGNVLAGTIAIYADLHCTQGLAEFMLATQGTIEEGMRVLNESYDALEKNMFDPFFKDIFENTWSEKFIWHDMYLTALSVAEVCTPILGENRTRRLVDESLDKILYWFTREEFHVVLEAIKRDNTPDLTDLQGRFVNPGHMTESMWFCLDTNRRLKNQQMQKRILDVLDWAFDIGYDKEYNGLYAFVDVDGGPPKEALDWYVECGCNWNDKVWWPNAEALCAFAMAYADTGEERFGAMFERQHEFCKDYFYDPDYGEWYSFLNRDGSVKSPEKGSRWKCAFHVIRALVFTYESMERAAQRESALERYGSL